MNIQLRASVAFFFMAVGSFTLLAPARVHAENFGDKFARCVVQEQLKPRYSKEVAWKLCEKLAQQERDAELALTESRGPNTKLLKAALAFHWCVEKQTHISIAAPRQPIFKNGSEAEGVVWNEVLDRCFPVLTAEESQAMIYQNYQGNEQLMIAFRDGLLWSGRAYVLSAAVDRYGPKR